MWDPIPENSGPCNQHYFVMKQMWIIKRFSKKSIAETKSKQDIEKVEPKKRGQKKRPESFSPGLQSRGQKPKQSRISGKFGHLKISYTLNWRLKKVQWYKC